MEFKILKKSKKSKARLGILKTPHGEVETPAMVPVATQGAVKALTSGEAEKAGTQLLIANTFHLHLKPGEEIVKENGGLHKFMNWKRPLMTDSGGFQVFSLGFGREHGMGKILKSKSKQKVVAGQQPKLLRITDDGVQFTSPVDGRKIFLNPEKSIKIQEALGADIIFAFDECTSPIATYEYTKISLERTHRWALESLEALRSLYPIPQTLNPALFGIVQGGKFKDLRIESAKFIGGLPFDGFGIGGEFGDDKKIMSQMLGWVLKELPEEKPRHLLGIGYLEDIPKIIKAGVDTFDCIVPTRYARHGTAFTAAGKLDISKGIYLKDKKPLDPKCDCEVCAGYTRSYISHLFKAKEITALRHLTFHNIYFFNNFVAKIREDIKKGRI
ncbi:MAG: tRNA guanosine(34) transglycosylase Tgt [Candidatus Liptonbacteria bacterium]|nr:tRNA guanosine(34) transglycosylase Tgt [Candidatus Liptonbacteria bacterium]